MNRRRDTDMDEPLLDYLIGWALVILAGLALAITFAL
jgi:hypothetical protein